MGGKLTYIEAAYAVPTLHVVASSERCRLVCRECMVYGSLLSKLVLHKRGYKLEGGDRMQTNKQVCRPVFLVRTVM